MRNRASLSCVLLLLALTSPALLCAQFQEPTQDELKMTADPKSPGAAAVFLNVEEVTDDTLHYHMVYARIKVLSEKAKGLANVEIRHQRGTFKVTDIKARTIHADGTVIPLTGKPEDLLVAKKGNAELGEMVFTLPGVEVGSILEYRYQIRYDDNQCSSPFWEIQRPYFVHEAHYAFTPFKGFLSGSQSITSHYLVDAKGNVENNLLWAAHLPPGVTIKTDAIGRFSIEVEDIPPIPAEQWMPPVESFLYRVFFYYKAAYNGQDFWITEAKNWSKDVDHFAEPTKPIRDAVAGLIASGDSDETKARKLYKAVQALDNTNFSRRKSEVELKESGLHEARRAEDTWAQKSGSSQDITLLYLAMLRAAGLSAYDMKVVNRARSAFDPTYLEFSQLTDDVIILNLAGKEIPLDPGQRMCPFQVVNWHHSGASGVRQSSAGPAIATTPFQAYTANTLLRSGDLNVDDHGAVTGRFTFVFTGQEALRWRQMAIQTDPDEVKRRFDRTLKAICPDSIEAHLDHFLGLDDPDVNLMAIVKVEGTLGTATPKRLLLPGFFFETKEGHPFVDQEKRFEPVDMLYADQVSEQVIYHLPADMVVEGAPLTASIHWPQHAALATKTTPAPGQVTIARQLSRAFTLVKPEEYQSLHDFYQKVATADQQQLVLTVALPAKGN